MLPAEYLEMHAIKQKGRGAGGMNKRSLSCCKPLWKVETLTQWGEVSVLGAEKKKINANLLSWAIQCKFFVEVCGGAKMLHSLQTYQEKNLKLKCWLGHPGESHGSVFLMLPCSTLALARWLGSSLDCSEPAPSVGSCVWNTLTRPPVGDMSLKAACRAGPSALCVSLLWLNVAGREVSRSLISCAMREDGTDKRI